MTESAKLKVVWNKHTHVLVSFSPRDVGKLKSVLNSGSPPEVAISQAILQHSPKNSTKSSTSSCTCAMRCAVLRHVIPLAGRRNLSQGGGDYSGRYAAVSGQGCCMRCTVLSPHVILQETLSSCRRSRKG
eukprot:1418411-Rhodomonas_salina.4